MEVKNTAFLKRIIVISLASTACIAGVSLLTKSDFSAVSIHENNIIPLLVLITLWIFASLADSLALYFFLKGYIDKITLFSLYRIVSIKNFYNLLTPFNLGGQVATINELKKKNITSGKGYSIVMLNSSVYSVINMSGGIIVIFCFGNYVIGNAGIYTLFVLAGILASLFGALFIAALFFSGPVIGVASGVLRICRKIGFQVNEKNTRTHLAREIINFRRCLVNFLSRHKFHFICGTFFLILFYCTRILMFWMLLLIFGIDVDIGAGCVMSALILFSLPVIPTPGGIGLGEAVISLIALYNIPSRLLGPVIISWKLFYQYLNAAVGAIYSIKG